MKISSYQEEKKQRDRIKAIELYKQGFSMRQVSKLIGYSHSWVYQALKAVGVDNSINKN